MGRYPVGGPETGSTSEDFFQAAKGEGRQCAFTPGGLDSWLETGPQNRANFGGSITELQYSPPEAMRRVTNSDDPMPNHIHGLQNLARQGGLSINVAIWKRGVKNTKNGSPCAQRCHSSLATISSSSAMLGTRRLVCQILFCLWC